MFFLHTRISPSPGKLRTEFSSVIVFTICHPMYTSELLRIILGGSTLQQPSLGLSFTDHNLSWTMLLMNVLFYFVCTDHSRSVILLEEKTGVMGENPPDGPCEQEQYLVPTIGSEPRLHWWKETALSTESSRALRQRRFVSSIYWFILSLEFKILATYQSISRHNLYIESERCANSIPLCFVYVFCKLDKALFSISIHTPHNMVSEWSQSLRIIIILINHPKL